MTHRDYWTEAVESSLEEAGITATTEQIENIAGDMEVSHEQYGMAFGCDVASHNYQSAKDSEIDRLKKELRDERNKTVCKECKGKGYIRDHGPYHSAEFECSKCNGEGRL